MFLGTGGNQKKYLDVSSEIGWETVMAETEPVDGHYGSTRKLGKVAKQWLRGEGGLDATISGQLTSILLVILYPGSSMKMPKV